MLTVYADGYVQPNAEAAAILSATAAGACFHAPVAVRRGRRPRLWEISAGGCPDKPGQLRFRAAGKCPPPGRYVLTAIAENPTRFCLLPVV